MDYSSQISLNTNTSTLSGGSSEDRTSLMSGSNSSSVNAAFSSLSQFLLQPFCPSVSRRSTHTLQERVMASLTFLVCFVILSSHGASTYSAGRGRTLDFGIVIDAGSSGSRVRIYGWMYTRPGDIPQFREAFNHKVRPGISAFNTPEKDLSQLDDYIGKLLQEAKNYIPYSQRKTTPIFVMATAGMRLLLEPKADAIMDYINDILLDRTRNPFLYDPLNCRILSGEEEGAFAWMSVNYLRGYFSNTDTMDSVGILEMGGASTQIAFIPDTSVLADKFPLTIGGVRYPLYVHSYLYYGQNLADRWVKEHLQEHNPSVSEIHNPCQIRGDEDQDSINGSSIRFIGSGSPEQCLDIMYEYVYKSEPKRCNPKPCAIGPVYQPTIKPNEMFYAVSAFLYSFKTLNVISDNGTFSPAELKVKAKQYCSTDKQTLLNETEGLEEVEEFLSDYCLMGLYSYVLFTTGYGFSEHTRQLVARETIKNEPVEWALGAIIYETQRYQQPCPETGAYLSSSSRQCSRITPSQTALLTVLYLVLVNRLLTRPH